ncbi:hypothetical protein [Weissella viridescens]|uniref:hypothetical protein n=1 Tax=Weissella viridescens TaxID=1629 RepID=UPI003AA96927
MEQVSKGMMKELEHAKLDFLPYNLSDVLFSQFYKNTPEISKWYASHGLLSFAEITELQLELIKHIWLNDPQFEEEKPKKYVVQSKEADTGGDFRYLIFQEAYGVTYTVNEYVNNFYKAEKFDTREEAEKWTNPLMEVVEVEE